MYTQNEVKFRVLVAVAMTGKTITYKEFAIALGINHRNMSEPLADVGRMCKERGVPHLGSLVVRKDTGLPGDGWVNDDGTGYGNLDPKVEQKLCWAWAQELKKESVSFFCRGCGKQMWSVKDARQGTHQECAFFSTPATWMVDEVVEEMGYLPMKGTAR